MNDPKISKNFKTDQEWVLIIFQQEKEQYLTNL